jgi:fructokinase
MNFKNGPVLCFGEALWDCLPAGREAGGAPLNVAVHLKKLEHEVLLVSSTGNDQRGHELRSFMKKSGVDINCVQTDPVLHTSEVKVFLDANNNASYEIVEHVAWDNIIYNNMLEAAAGESAMIVFGTLAARESTTRNTLLTLLEKIPVKVLDVNLRPPFVDKKVIELLIAKANIIKLNLEELQYLTNPSKRKYTEKTLITKFAEQYQSEVIIVTRGADGAVLFDRGEFFEHPGYKVTVADTVGAGDAFLAGFLSSLLQGKSSRSALDYGSAAGAYVASKKGATPEYRKEDLTNIMQQYCM